MLSHILEATHVITLGYLFLPFFVIDGLVVVYRAIRNGGGR